MDHSSSYNSKDALRSSFVVFISNIHICTCISNFILRPQKLDYAIFKTIIMCFTKLELLKTKIRAPKFSASGMSYAKPQQQDQGALQDISCSERQARAAIQFCFFLSSNNMVALNRARDTTIHQSFRLKVIMKAADGKIRLQMANSVVREDYPLLLHTGKKVPCLLQHLCAWHEPSKRPKSKSTFLGKCH